jgi:hypothetical protein
LLSITPTIKCKKYAIRFSQETIQSNGIDIRLFRSYFKYGKINGLRTIVARFRLTIALLGEYSLTATN